MKYALKKYSFCAVIAIAALVFSGCSKKNRCSDCPKWSKSEVKASGTRV